MRVVLSVIAVVMGVGQYGFAQGAWKEFRAPAGGFSVEMPGTPKEDKQVLDTAVGKVDLFTFLLEVKDVVYLVSYNDYPSDTLKNSPSSKVLDDWRDGFAKGVKGKVRSEKYITLKSNPGREVIVDAPNDLVFKVRAYLVKQRLYQTLVAAPKNLESSPDATKFLDSFKLLTVETDSWKEFRSPAGRFSVRLPGAPKEDKQAIDTAAGKIDMFLFTYEVSNDVAYLIIYSDYPEDLIVNADKTKMLDGARDGAVKNVKGTLRSEKNISLSGWLGREIVIDTPDDPASTIKSRMYLVKNRLYQVMAVMPKGKETSKDVDKFLDSFKLTP
ncbi:MAG: hypothetical protein RMK49_05760 [Abditibacteriales bacterium]|nr:hypothetical protein [Abditibacteriales bacterium]